MASWQDPSEGYTTFSGQQSDLFSLKQTYDEVILAADAAKTFVANAWVSDASTALQANVQAYRDSIPDIKAVLESARQALITYKASLTAVANSQGHYLTEYHTMDRLLQHTDRDPWVDPVGAADDKVDRVNHWLRFEAAKYELERLYSQRREADGVVIAALSASMPASWTDTSAAFAAAGVTQSVLLSSSQSEDAMLDLAQRMLDGDMSDENVAALTGLLSVWSGSSTTMSTFFKDLGGGNVAQLIDMLGNRMSKVSEAYGELDDTDQATLTLANYIRAGLSSGAEGWDQTYANEFARELLTGNSDYFEGRLNYASGDPSVYSAQYQAVSFLFSDPHGNPMPEELSLGAAIMVDELEDRGMANSSQLVNWVNPEVGVGAGVFGFYTEDGVYTGDMAQMDLAGRVFESLGLYPDSSLEFLTTGDGRIEYWFGERDWSYGDGFAGPGGLWAGAAAVDGPESALAASEIMWALSENPSFASENVSEMGSAKLAIAISYDLATMTEFATSPPEKWDPESGQFMVTLFGEDSATATPAVDVGVLATILGVTGAHDTGAAILQGAASDYQQGYFDYGMANPEDFQEALRRANSLQGAIDGAGIGEQLAAAERSDTRREEMIDSISTLVGIIPLPSVGGLVVEGGSFVLDLIQNSVVAVGTEGITGLAMGGPADYNAALLSTEVTGVELKDARAYANGVALWNYLQSPAAAEYVDASGIPTPEAQRPTESDAAFIARSNLWYETNKEDLNTAARLAFEDDNFELKVVLGAYTAYAGDAEGEVNK